MRGLCQTILFFHFLVHQVMTQICTMDEFSKGTWIYNSKKAEKDFICCPNDLRNISAEVRVACERQRVDTGFCACDMKDDTFLSVNEREKWNWVPSL
jgi:hypothetical protein